MEQHADPSMTEVPPPRTTVNRTAPLPSVSPVKRQSGDSEMTITLDESPASRAFVETTMPKKSGLTTNPAAVAPPKSGSSSSTTSTRSSHGDNDSSQVSTTVLKMLANAIRSLEMTVNRRLDSVESILARIISEGKSNLQPLHQTIEGSANSIGAVRIMLDILSQNAKDMETVLQALAADATPAVANPAVANPADAESSVATAVGLSVAESHAPSKQDGGSAFIGGPSEYMVIMPDEFEKIQRDRNLKHIWVFMNYKDGEPARKIRVSGITVEEIQYVYSKGGAVYPFSKTCEDWSGFIGARNRYFLERNRY